MPLSSDLISEFVQVTAEQVDIKPTESTVYGTIVVYDEEKYVQLDGSDILTPIDSTTESNDGDRVMVLIKNHTATVTGNITDKSASSNRVTSISEELVTTNTLIAETIKASDAKFNTLDAGYAKIDTLEAGYAKIDALEAGYAKIDALEAGYAKIDTLETTYATIENLEATNASIKNLSSTYATIENLNATNASIEELKADIVTTETLEAKYANIEFGNIGEAAIKKLYATSGIIENGTFKDGKFTGALTGVTINGDLINANTLKADKLIVRGKDGLYYKLNVDENGAVPEGVTEDDLQNGLHGSHIIAKSITADQISVSDLEAFKATIGGFEIAENAIHSVVKKTVDNTTVGIYMDSDGQFVAGDATNYVKFFKDTDDTFKLDISADSIKLRSGTTLSEVADRVTNAETQITQTATEISAKLNTVDYYGVRQFDGVIARSDCYENQGIRVVGEFGPIQSGSGDPSTDNIRSIAGRDSVTVKRCGKNLGNIETCSAGSLNIAWDITNDTMRIYTTAEQSWSGVRFEYISLKAGMTYTGSIYVDEFVSGYMYYGLRDASTNTYLSSGRVTATTTGHYTFTYTATEDLTAYLAILITNGSILTGDITVSNMMLEIGDTATEYEAYQGDTYTVDLGNTVYEGALDVNAGTLTLETQCVTLDGTENWFYNSSGTYPFLSYDFADYGTIVEGTCICSHATRISIAASTNNIGVNIINSSYSNKARILFRPGIDSVVDADTWKTYLAEQYDAGTPVQICYTLSEPSVSSVTSVDIPALDGLNTVWTDMDDGFIEFGHDSLSGLGGVSMFEMTTELNLKAGSAELVVTSNRLYEAETKLTQLADSISTLVKGQNGESLMTQTDTGWTFDISNITSTLNTAASDINTLKSDATSTSTQLESLGDALTDVSKKTEYVTIGVDENDQPTIILGENDSDFKVKITNTDIQFMEGTTVPASISNQALNIEKAVISDELRQGGFVWIARSNGNYGLMWRGADS